MSVAVGIIERMFATLSDTTPQFQTIPAGLDAMEPGPRLAAYLWGIDVERVSEYDRVVVLRAHERMLAHHQAESWRAMRAVVDAYDPAGERRFEDVDSAATEVRVALCLTRRAAETEVGIALDVGERLPAVGRALTDGRICRRRAWALVDGTLHLPEPLAREVIGRIIERAPELTTGQLRARLRRLCLEVDPDHAAARLERGVADRRVVTQSHPDGTVELCALGLAPDKAAAATERINRIARSLRGPHESRTMDQLRADVVCDLLIGDAHQSARAGGLELTVDLPTLIGLRDRAGDLAGYGPLLGDLTRRVAADKVDAPWRYTITDPATGDLWVGVTRRRPDTMVTRRVRARHRRCVFPGCRMPAVDCDLDHRTPHAAGGATTERNLAPLCRHDHCARHNGWTYQRLPHGAPPGGGAHRWTSPLGHTYTTRDEPP
jgi:hypothetical protein